MSELTNDPFGVNEGEEPEAAIDGEVIEALEQQMHFQAGRADAYCEIVEFLLKATKGDDGKAE